MRTLVAIPVYNEERHVRRVLDRVLQYASDVVVVDDGSTDATTQIVAEYRVNVLRRIDNRGYGRSLREAFGWAICQGYDWVVTMDCDDQHEPESLPDFFREIERDRLDLISGSRYLSPAAEASVPPDRLAINRAITAEINERFGLSITDAFCGFKAHRVESLRQLTLCQDGYAFPMQLWVQSVALGHRIGELPVKLIYNDPNRTFGASLDNPQARLAHYRRILHREICRWRDRLPAEADAGLTCGVGCA